VFWSADIGDAQKSVCFGIDELPYLRSVLNKLCTNVGNLFLQTRIPTASVQRDCHTRRCPVYFSSTPLWRQGRSMTSPPSHALLPVAGETAIARRLPQVVPVVPVVPVEQAAVAIPAQAIRKLLKATHRLQRPSSTGKRPPRERRGSSCAAPCRVCST
jgi:hypothetical protein